MNPANPNNGQPQQPQQGQRPNIIKMVLMYMAINYVISNFFKSGGSTEAPKSAFVNLFHNNEPLVQIIPTYL